MVDYAKAAVMTEPNKDLEIREFPLPEVAKGCILVRITCCTICGSDIHSWLGKRPAPTPLILGHEIVGRIAVLGEGVTRDSGDRPLKEGDRITWTLMDSCGKCYYCREKGLTMKCRHLKKYGHDSCEDPPHFVGGFGEYCYLTPGTCVIKVPDHLSDEAVAPANCALATVLAGWEAAEIQPLENVLILGAGALGFYAAALASHAGCRRIIAGDRLEQRLTQIRDFGATDTIHVGRADIAEISDTVATKTGSHGVDCCFEVAGAPELIPLGLKCLRKGGRFIEIGTSFPDAEFSYDASDIVWRRLTIKGVHNYDMRHLQFAIDLLATAGDRYPFQKIVTHRFQLAEINAAMAMAASGEAIRVAVLP